LGNSPTGEGVIPFQCVARSGGRKRKMEIQFTEGKGELNLILETRQVNLEGIEKTRGRGQRKARDTRKILDEER